MFRVQCCDRSGSCRRDGLPVSGIKHIARGEYSRDARTGTALLDRDGAIGIEVEFAMHEMRSRVCPDRNEQPLKVEDCFATAKRPVLHCL